MYFNENGELIVQMSDGTEINAGKPTGGNQAEEKAAVTITGYEAEISVDYGTTITFSAQAENAPEGSEIHWFVNGEDQGEGSEFTVKEAKGGFNVCAKLVKDGSSIAESPTEKVTVKSDFFSRIIAFFKKLFSPDKFVIIQK